MTAVFAYSGTRDSAVQAGTRTRGELGKALESVPDDPHYHMLSKVNIDIDTGDIE